VRVLAFRHVPFEGAGRLEPILAARGYTIEYVDLYHSDAPIPDMDGAAGLIFLGGPMSVNDDLPYLRKEMCLISRAIARQQPVLGICLGAQLIAKTLGAKVYRNPVKEVGWYNIRITDAAGEDALFRDVSPCELVFHWHGETFDLPRGAVRLAGSAVCKNQAYRFGINVYGLQFHLEVTPEMIAEWCVQDENCGDVRELSAPLDAYLHQAAMTKLADFIFSRWCEIL
jgi:GMP synthase-like glutamine amidotransferase